MKKIVKDVKGFTLMSLVVTIVVMIILTVVSVNMALNKNGLLGRAKNASNGYEKAESNESGQLNELTDRLSNSGNYYLQVGTIPGSEIANAKNNGTVITNNTRMEDDKGNMIWIPAGFKIASDSATEVSKGIVIEDVSAGDSISVGNQFVWIPVGTISTKAKNSNDTTIALGRYSFDGTTGAASEFTDTAYVEETAAQHTTSGYGNAIAKNINGFKTSVGTKGGYYLARYEAGLSENTVLDSTNFNINSSIATTANWTGYTNGKIVIQKGKQIWNYVTQNKASELARGMYSANTNITSDLVNSYAWDTAVLFIEQCGNEWNSMNYANTPGESADYNNQSNPGTAGTSQIKATGAIDIQCNIYDMAGNICEWNTETHCDSNSPCTEIGGQYDCIGKVTSDYESDDYTTNAYIDTGFRTILYF